MGMLRKLFFTLGLLLTTGLMLYSQGVLTGTITDASTKEPLPFVNVIVEQNGQQMGGAQTDVDGNYQIKPLAPGDYDIRASFVGYKTVLKTGVKVNASGFSKGGNIEMAPTSEMLNTVEIVEYAIPLLEQGTSESGKRISAEDLDNMTANSVDAIIANVGGITDSDGGAGSARGESSMVTYVNGVAKKGSVNIPKQAIAEIQVILGGTPASIGEAIGGSTNITLKPPQNTFTGYVQYQTSEFLDTRGYHRGDFYFTGPLLKKTDAGGVSNSIIGYRLSGFVTYAADSYLRPKDRRYYMIKDDVLENLKQNPLVYDPSTGAVNYAAEFLTMKDFEQVGRKSNLWSNSIYVEGGLDFRFSKNSMLQINAEFVNSIGMNGSISSMLMNNYNNSESKSHSIQLMGDFTQKFNSEQSSLIKNVIFNLTASYSKSYSEAYNKDHGDDLFRYGHVGTFHTYKRPMYELTRMDIDGDGSSEYVYEQNGWMDYQVDYTPSEYNPGLSAYTSQLFYDNAFSSLRPYLYNYDNIKSFKGLVNGDMPSSVYSMFTNVGVVGSSYSKSESQYIYAAARVSADIGKHSIELGFQYDQSIYRGYSLAASSLWTIMKQEANQHLLYRDLDNPIIDESGMYPTVSYNRKYDAGSQTFFDKQVRQKLGLAVDGTEWIDIDSYDPSTFSLDMFSADELFNTGGSSSLVSYYGYDHTGEKITGKQSLQDFFTGVDGKRNIGAWEPIYMAGYIQDKFYFNDLIFNIGIRVDRFDGNQQGLKDPYLLYSSYTAGDLRNAGRGSEVPNSIGDDYILYVDKLSSSSTLDNVEVRGFRNQNGNSWYNANGEVVSNPNDISGSSGQPLPFRKGELSETGLPKQISTDAFKDYEPQIVAMPRIAFSFPVSDKSEFKASYDVIARRPSAGYWQASYDSYLYMEKMSGAALTNPNLKPEKITNYELGFQQVLSQSSALGITAYYKQTRDLIALVQYVGADPTNLYYSYANQDFRTTKGFTISYDLRRSKNVRVNANYTLQYAEGTTGLPSSTIVSLIKAGYPNIKMLFPISDDRRHEFKVNLDFRYLGGDKYNGPVTSRVVTDKNGNEVVKNFRWLQNFGVNITAVAQSGSPYTKYHSNIQQTIVGSYRGARLPWSFRVDLSVDKSYNIKVGKKPTVLNFFARITNVFNIKNIRGVYGVTGDPDDNGYLTDPETQTIIAGKLNEQAYRDYYYMYLNNANYNYSTPRMVYVGLSYQF